MNPFLKILLVCSVLALFHFYYTYFRITLAVRRRLGPWKRALKRISEKTNA